MTKTTSNSYKLCNCGEGCVAFESNPDQPCWGQVSAVDEVETSDGDWVWIHACEGHWDLYDSQTLLNTYKAENIE